MKNKVLTILYIVAFSVLILTFSIGFPIYFRPFYYAQIKALELEKYSGYSFSEIKTAYDAVLNYLTIPFTKFSTGAFKHSYEGYLHFKDCKFLFMLNFYALVISAIIALIIPLILGTIAVIDFDFAFTLFHTMLFPGKSNWMFDYTCDPIILILPEEFFMACGIIIAVLVLAICITTITVCAIKKIKERN